MRKFKLPKPIKDITDLGLDKLGRMVHNSPITTTSAGMSVDQVQDYLDTLEVEERIEFSHTTEALSTWFYKSSNVNYKDQRRTTPPLALVFLVTGSYPDKKYQMLPFYNYSTTKEATTGSFFPADLHKFYCYRRYISIVTENNSASTFTYDIYILKDRVSGS